LTTEALVGEDVCDQTFSYDISDNYNAWVRTLPPDTRVVWPEGRRYIANKTLRHDDKVMIDVAGNGASVYQTTDGKELLGTNAPRVRSHFEFKRCNVFTIADLRMVGVHGLGGPGGYVPELEAQHGVNVFGGGRGLIRNVVVDHVYGDGVYLGGDCVDMRVTDVWVAYTGRMGMAVTRARNSVIENFDIRETARSTFDCEPLGGAWGFWVVDGLIIRNGKVGRKGLPYLLANKGGGVSRNVQLYNIACDEQTTVQVQCASSDKGRRSGYLMVNCRSLRPNHGEDSGAVAKFTNIDGVVCCYNEQPRCQARITSFGKFDGCTDVTQSHNVIR
jgi:hypothetical protein